MTFAEAVVFRRDQNEQLNRYCHELGRPPSALRQLLLAWMLSDVDPLSSPDAFDEFVGRYAEAGVTEFVFTWPPTAIVKDGAEPTLAQESTFESIAAERVSARQRER